MFFCSMFSLLLFVKHVYVLRFYGHADSYRDTGTGILSCEFINHVIVSVLNLWVLPFP